MTTLVDSFASIVLNVLVYMTAWFLLAVSLKRRDVIDSAWGVGFIVVAITAYASRNNQSELALFSVLLAAAWGIRLSVHIATRNWNKKEDYRYAQLGELGTFRFWLKTYVNVFLLQGLLMILISLPIIGIMHTTNAHIFILSLIGFGIWILGIVFEAIGDYQLRQFLKIKKEGQIMQTGLWRYTRHPNYFGEVTAWWGAAIVAGSFGQWWGIIGALVITFLITKVSGIPLLEKHYATNLEFQEYAKRTSIFFPLPFRSHEK